MQKVSILLLLLPTIFPPSARGQCHNQCSGNGDCNKYGFCDCWNGFEGWDCSSLTCPSSPAWVDVASAIDDAHNSAVCSNMGYCDG
ncbi:unnamed protein product [Hapterophycus canaliculatus]